MFASELRLDGHGDADLSAELTGENLGDVGPQATLDEVLGELVRGSEQCGVFDDSHGTGEAQERASLWAGLVGQGVEHPVPDGGQILGLRGHRRLPLLLELSDDLSSTSEDRRSGPRSTRSSTGCGWDRSAPSSRAAGGRLT